MASQQQVYETKILLNSEQATRKITELEKKVDELKRKRQEALDAGDTKSWTKLNKEVVKYGSKLDSARGKLVSINKTLNNMSAAGPKQLRDTIGDINKLLNSGTIERGSSQWKALTASIKEAKTELKKIEGETKAATTAWGRFFKFLNDSWGGLTMLLATITGITMTVRKSVQDYATIEEEMADVRKYTGLADEAVRDLNGDLKKMDTRTSREELNKLAGAAGRLGKDAKEDILEFVEAGDMINTSLEEDLGDGSIEKIGKLAMAFGEDEKKGLKGAMLSTGSAINELVQNSPAMAGYLVDFTARVAGFGKQIGLTQAQIMGFGTVMDENLLQDEMAATAFGNMLTKMQTDTEKFAKIAGKDVKEFTDLLNTDANAAILALADSLKAADPQSMMKMLDEMGLDGSRAVSVLSTLADKIDDVRKYQGLATKAYEEATSIENEYIIKNTTVQAEIDKAKKRFHELSIELGKQLVPVVKYTVTGGSALVKILRVLITTLINCKSTILIAGSSIVLLTAYRQKDVIWAKAQVIWNEKVVVSLKNLYKAMLNNPWTVAFVAISAVVGVLIDLKRRAEEAANQQRDLTAAEREHKAWAESMKAVNDEVNKSTAEEITKFKQLRRTLEDNNKKYDERKKALDTIKKMVPDYHGTLTTENTLINNNSAALDNYVSNLMTAARAQAAFNRMVKLQEDSMSHQEKKEKRQGNKQWAENKLKDLGASSQTTFKYADWNVGYAMYDDQGKFVKYVDSAQKKQIEHYQKLVSYNERRINEENTILDINTKQSEKLQEMIDKTKPKDNKTSTYVSDADRKKQEAANKKAIEDARKQEQEKLKILREADKEQKAVTDSRLADNMLKYQAGLQDYRQFVAEQQRIQEEGLKARMDVWEKGSAEYEKYRKQLMALELNGDQEAMRMRQADMQRAHVLLMNQLERDFKTEGSAIYQNEAAYREARFQEEMAYLEDRKELTREGSLERMQVEWDIEDLLQKHKLEKEQYYQESLARIKQQYLQRSSEEQRTLEMNALNKLHEDGLIAEKEYQQARAAIRAQYADGQTPTESAQKTGSDMLAHARSEAAKESSASDGVPITGTISMYVAQMNKLKELYAEDKENHDAYLAAKAQATSEFCKQLASEIQAAYQGVGQIMSAMSSYYSAQSDYEVAITKKKYEKQIQAAGNNQVKVKKLQERQAKEEAAIKTKYNKKQVKIQIAQAIAQTAMNALNAYGSAAAIPLIGYIIAPIAAAMAVAAGMIQIAAIKKQAQAQEAGYYEGGFTGGRQYRKEAGVVHEGEFVANHQAVQNPAILPFLQFLDQAQRNNTVGSLTAQDVSRSMGTGDTRLIAPIVNVNTDNTELHSTLEKTNDSIDRLNKRLEKPLPAVVSAEQASKELDDWKRLKDNV